MGHAGSSRSEKSLKLITPWPMGQGIRDLTGVQLFSPPLRHWGWGSGSPLIMTVPLVVNFWCKPNVEYARQAILLTIPLWHTELLHTRSRKTRGCLPKIESVFSVIKIWSDLQDSPGNGPLYSCRMSKSDITVTLFIFKFTPSFDASFRA